jgi:hypothetical protein
MLVTKKINYNHKPVKYYLLDDEKTIIHPLPEEINEDSMHTTIH